MVNDNKTLCRPTHDKQIGLPLAFILFCKLVWLQAELDSTRSYYHYESKL